MDKPVKPERRSPRLRGFDYSEPGEYFVTICTAGRECILGEVVKSTMVLSAAGEMVDECWREIPQHFPFVTLGVYQIMPNHFHGIIQLRDRVGTRHAVSLHPAFAGVFGHPKRDSLSTIIGSFKSAVTRNARKACAFDIRPLWQSRFFDRIIRDAHEHFMIEQYISLSPLLWHLDQGNPEVEELPTESIREALRRACPWDDYTIEWILAQQLD